MFLGKIFPHDPDVQCRRAPLPDLFRIGQHLAIFFQGVNRRCPDISTINISPLPCGDNRGRLQVHNLNLPRFNTPVFQRRQQAVVGGGDKRYGDAFTNQVFRFTDSFLYHQRFGVTQF